MSKDLLKKFLENAKEYPDATVVKIGDQDIPLGSLRALNSDERETLSTAIRSNQERERALEGDRQRVLDLAGKAQAAYDAAEEARKKGAAPQPGEYDWRKDPYFAGILADLASRDTKTAEYLKNFETFSNTVKNAATIFTEDRWDRQYEGIDQSKREKKYTREELLEYASKNNLLDRHKIPDVRLAFSKMTEGERAAELAKSEFEKGREAGRMEAMAARVPKPGVPGAGAPPPSLKTGPDADVMGDLYGEAIKDPELRVLIEQLPQGVV